MAKRNKNRRRVKKTKYLSLTSLRFPPAQPTTDHRHLHDHHHLLSLKEEKEKENDNMDYLLSSASDDGDATSLTALLLDSSSSAAAHLPVVVPNCNSDAAAAAASVSYVSEAINLVRTALRSRGERDSTSTPQQHHHHHHHHHVERYVRYSEVVDDRRDHEEVSSRIAVGATVDKMKGNNEEEISTSTMLMRRRRLALKLDYEEIINAWSDKGGFYVSPSPSCSEYPPQTVPDVIHPPSFTFTSTYGGGGLWSVPEGNFGFGGAMKEEEMEEEVARVPQDDNQLEQHRAPGQREASVLRYKQKRRNRLFSKTIRYQVRKENAQKRPRVKGRFVKRS